MGLLGRKKVDLVDSSVVNAGIGSSDLLPPSMPKEVVRPPEPQMTKREAEILALIEEVQTDYGMLSATDVANMSQAVRDAYLLNLVLAVAVEMRQLRVLIEKVEGDRI